MRTIGYHASHEQFPPSRLIDLVQQAENAGFDAAMCSDHFHPWSDAQGESGFAWSWLGAAMQATSLPMGTVCAPGQRYHPAIIAQAAATLAEMYPGRFWVALGSGELLNEHITGQRWPSKAERNQRLLESAEVMRALWRGETVSHWGAVTVDDARLYTRPETPPLIVGAALTPSTAGWMGGWADALITVSQPIDTVREILDAFRAGGGADRPVFLQVQLSYGPSEDEALTAAHEAWRTNVFSSGVLADLRMPEDFAAAAEFVRPDDIRDAVIVSAQVEEHVARIQEYVELGVDGVFLHNIHPDQETFIADFGPVLPQLRGADAGPPSPGFSSAPHVPPA